MRNIVEIASEHAQGQPVQRIRIEVGEHTAVVPQALQFCFEVVAKGTVLQAAQLDIECVAGRARCCACGLEFAMPVSGARCSCGELGFELLSGKELKILELEFAEEEQHV